MDSLPIISNGPIFTDDELRSCADGACCQCSNCCTTFTHWVPSIRGDADSPLMFKEAGVPCVQLIKDHRGRYACAVHADKATHPNLRVCREWMGNELTPSGTTGYESIVSAVAVQTVAPQNETALRTVTERLATGELHSDIQSCARNLLSISRNVVTSLKCYIGTFNIFHDDMFRFLDMYHYVRTSGIAPYHTLRDAKITPLHPLFGRTCEDLLQVDTEEMYRSFIDAARDHAAP